MSDLVRTQKSWFPEPMETHKRGRLMRKLLKTRGVDQAIAAIALIALTSTPTWAGLPNPAPGPPAALLAGGAIIGTLVIAKWWRRK